MRLRLGEERSGCSARARGFKAWDQTPCRQLEGAGFQERLRWVGTGGAPPRPSAVGTSLFLGIVSLHLACQSFRASPNF